MRSITDDDHPLNPAKGCLWLLLFVVFACVGAAILWNAVHLAEAADAGCRSLAHKVVPCV